MNARSTRLGKTVSAWVAALAGGVGILAYPCAAQEGDGESPPSTASSRTQPAEDPELDDPRLDEDARAMQKQGSADTRVSPVRERTDEPSQPGLPGPLEALPGLEGTDFLLRAPVIRSEGVFLTMQRGTVVRGKGGEWWFVFHRDAEGHAERPMILLPCQTLERMATAAEQEAGPVFRTTGQVFVYGGRNYFLPTTAVLAAGSKVDPEAVPTGPPTSAADEPTGSPDAGPTVKGLMEELSGEGDHARALGSPAAGGGAGASGAGTESAGAAEMVSEGKLVARRRGRMVRQSAAWAFAFDNDADGRGERPMVLVPCLNLEAMEKIAAKQGDGVIFELSGRVLAYRGRNYIIPTMFQVVRDREIRPLQ